MMVSRRFWGMLGAVLIWLAAGAPVIAATAATPAKAPQDLYLEAMRSIADGRQNDASDILSRMIELEPMHAGAWLDLAIIQCELGHAREAEALFAAIINRFAPPPEIVEVIAANRARGCALWRADSKWSLLIGRGYDSNVNQGSSTPSFTFGLGNDQVEAQLLPDYLPRPDQFTILQGDYRRDLSPNGTVGTVQFQARTNHDISAFDTAAVVLGIEQPWRFRDWSVRGIGTLGLLTLNGRLYQGQASAQLRITPWLPLPENVQLTLMPGVAHVQYPTLGNYNSNTAELRSQLTWRLPQTEFTASLGYAADFGSAARPGGDRKGWATGLRGNTRIAGDVFGEFGWTRQTWQSSTAYSPGLIESIRRQDTQVLRGALIFPVRPHQTVQLEVRNVRNKENISIFQYDSRQIQLSWQWQDF